MTTPRPIVRGARRCPACKGTGRIARWCRLPTGADGRCAHGHAPTLLRKCPSSAPAIVCPKCDGAGCFMPIKAVIQIVERIGEPRQIPRVAGW